MLQCDSQHAGLSESGPCSDVWPCFLVQDGKESVVKEVFPGDSVHSLLSILDVITVSTGASIAIGRWVGD